MMSEEVGSEVPREQDSKAEENNSKVIVCEKAQYFKKNPEETFWGCSHSNENDKIFLDMYCF